MASKPLGDFICDSDFSLWAYCKKIRSRFEALLLCSKHQRESACGPAEGATFSRAFNKVSKNRDKQGLVRESFVWVFGGRKSVALRSVCSDVGKNDNAFTCCVSRFRNCYLMAHILHLALGLLIRVFGCSSRLCRCGCGSAVVIRNYFATVMPECFGRSMTAGIGCTMEIVEFCICVFVFIILYLQVGHKESRSEWRALLS